MNTPIPVVIVEREVGGRLPNGDFSGIGGKTTYYAGYMVDGLHKVATSPPYATHREAANHADRVVARMQKEYAA